MKSYEIIGMAALALGAVAFATLYLRDLRRRSGMLRAAPKRILFPFVGRALSRRALEASLRLARSDGATLVPIFLVRVPLHLPLESPLPRECNVGMPLLETIEQRAFALGVPVDARLERGRTVRHALREAISHERFDRLVVAAAGGLGPGFHNDDIAWLLEHAPGEVVVVRPVGDDRVTARRRLRRSALRQRQRGGEPGAAAGWALDSKPAP